MTIKRASLYIRIVLTVLCIVHVFLPIYKDLTGFEMTYFQFQPFVSLVIIFYSIIHFMYSTTNDKEKMSQYNVALFDLLWLVLVMIYTVQVYFLNTSLSVYTYFQASYMQNHQNYPMISSITDFVNFSTGFYISIGVSFLMIFYNGWMYLLRRINNKI